MEVPFPFAPVGFFLGNRADYPAPLGGTLISAPLPAVFRVSGRKKAVGASEKAPPPAFVELPVAVFAGEL